MKVIQFRQMEGGVYRILQACKLLKIKRSVFMRNMRRKNHRKNYLLFTISKI